MIVIYMIFDNSRSLYYFAGLFLFFILNNREINTYTMIW